MIEFKVDADDREVFIETLNATALACSLVVACVVIFFL
jgi:seryl-tRNA synthetase